MSQFLKQSTAVDLSMGPFLDSSDGDTEETALSIAVSDVRLSKNAGTYAAKGEATAPAHQEKGNYLVKLNTTDTNTLGRLRVYIHVTGALAVWQDFQVLPANVYDSIVAGSDNLQVDTTQWAGAATATDDVALSTAPTNFSSLAITAGGATTVGTNNDKTGYSVGSGGITTASFAAGAINAAAIATDAIGSAEFSQAAADKIWSSTTRTITGGTVTTNNDKTGYSISGTKTTLDALNDISAAQVNAEVDSALDTAIPTTPTANSINERIKTIDDNYTIARAGNLDNLDAAVSTRSSHSAGDVWGVATRTITGGTITTNNDKTGYATTTADKQSTADEVLNRNLAGGGSGNTRNVRNALRFLRNRWVVSAGTLSVKEEDDTTEAWSAAVTTAASTEGITEVDPT